MQIGDYLTELAGPPVCKLLTDRAVRFDVVLHVLARYHVHDSIDIAARAFNHVIDSRKILVLQRFEDIGLRALVHPSLELLFYTLDDDINIQTVFVRAVQCAHPALAKRSDRTVAASKIRRPLTGFVIIHAHSSTRLLRRKFVFQTIKLRLNLRPVKIIAFAAVLRRVIGRRRHCPGRFGSLSASRAAEALSESLLSHRICDAGRFAGESAFFHDLACCAVRCFLGHLLGDRLSVVFRINLDTYRYQINISFNFDLTPYIEGE